jgi:triacylglycerol lipase
MLWAKQNAERFGIDVDRVGIFGYSAGGHLSALVASLADETIGVRASASQWPESDQRWNELPAIRAVCIGGPPCDFRSLQPDNLTLAFFLGGSRREMPEVYEAASPAAHVSPGDPVTQLIHGESDLLVPISESQQFHELQRAAGIDSRFEIMPKQGHMITFLNPKTNQKMLEFFQEVLLKPAAVTPNP